MFKKVRVKYPYLQYHRISIQCSRGGIISNVTGCPRSEITFSMSFNLRTKQVRPHVGKAKMCLRNIQFFLLLQLFVYNKFKIIENVSLLHPSIHGLMGKMLDFYARCPGFESHSGIIMKMYFY